MRPTHAFTADPASVCRCVESCHRLSLTAQIVKSLAELMDGRAYIASTSTDPQNHGTVFSVEIRIETSSTAAPADSAQYLGTLKRRNVLVVGPNTPSCTTLAKHLSFAGANVTVREPSTVLKALEAADRPFDLAVVSAWTPSAIAHTLAAAVRTPLLTVARRSGPIPGYPGTSTLCWPVKASVLLSRAIELLNAATPTLRSPGSPDPALSPPLMSLRRAAKAIPLIAPEHPLRILVVDDSSVNVKVLVQVLLKLGYPAEAIDRAENGRIAVDKAIAHRFDVILMDIQVR